MQNNYPRGIVIALLGAFFLATMSATGRVLGKEFHWSETLFFRFGLSLIMLLPLIRIKDLKPTASFKQSSWLITRVCVGLSVMALYFQLLPHIPTANAILFVQTAPIYVPLFAYLFLRIKTNLSTWVGIGIACVGMVIILHPAHQVWSIYLLFALLTGCGNGLGNLAIRMCHHHFSTKQILFAYYFAGTVGMGIIMIFHWNTPNLHQLLFLGLVGISGHAYTSCLTNAYRYAPARFLSPVFLSSTIFAAGFDWIFWHHIPTQLMMLGASILIIGLVWIATHRT